MKNNEKNTQKMKMNEKLATENCINYTSMPANLPKSNKSYTSNCTENKQIK